MNWCKRLIIQKFFLAMLALFAFTTCKHVGSSRKAGLELRDDTLKISPSGQEVVSLHSRWTDSNSGPTAKKTIIMVPGSGNQSLTSIQSGDGFRNYSKPLELGTVWQEKLARAGYDVFSYDKRLGTSGPKSLSSDVDAACSAVAQRFGSHHKILLWSSEQGTQVVLSAKCVQKATAIVLISPIPDRLDRLWVAGLKEAGHRNKAESLSATFESIKKGLFAPDAKVMGASLSFWREWLDLAEKTPKQLESLQTPILFVVGEDDVLVGRYGRKVLERIVTNNKNHKLIIVPKADRNLLQKEALSQATVETILGALGVLGNHNG